MIDREADLLMRGVREGNLDGLRKRISTLFLQYIKTPTFNPEAAKLLKVHTKSTDKTLKFQFNYSKSWYYSKVIKLLIFLSSPKGSSIEENYLTFSLCFSPSGASRSLSPPQEHLLLPQLQPVPAFYRVCSVLQLPNCWQVPQMYEDRQRC